MNIRCFTYSSAVPFSASAILNSDTAYGMIYQSCPNLYQQVGTSNRNDYKCLWYKMQKLNNTDKSFNKTVINDDLLNARLFSDVDLSGLSADDDLLNADVQGLYGPRVGGAESPEALYPCYNYTLSSNDNSVSTDTHTHIKMRSIKYPDGGTDIWAVRVPKPILALDGLKPEQERTVQDYSAVKAVLSASADADFSSELLVQFNVQFSRWNLIQELSVKRSRKAVYRLVRYHGLGGLVTFTFGQKENVIDAQQAQNLVQLFLKVHGQKYFGNAPFVSVAERYPNSNGYHVHCATWGRDKLRKEHYNGGLIPFKEIITCWTNFLAGQGITSGENSEYCRWNYGIENGKHANISPENCARYISKYITKSDFIDYVPNKHRYRSFNCFAVPFDMDLTLATLEEAEQIFLAMAGTVPQFFADDEGVIYGFRGEIQEVPLLRTG